MPGPTFEPLGRKHDRAAFSCAEEALTRYLRTQALQDAERRVAAPVVLIDGDGATIIGYYTLSAAEVALGRMRRDVARRLPRYPYVPAARLGRLAVDARYERQGHGESLLMHALSRAEQNSYEVAAAAVIVDAKNERAARWYAKYGFRPFEDNPLQLCLPMSEIRANRGAAGP